MTEFDVVGVGLNATDTLILLSHFPAYAGKVAFEREILSPGGQVASAMVTCAKLGLRAKYIGTVGDDERGRIQLESLRESGINLDDLEVRENCPNQTAYILIDQTTGERTVLWQRDDSLRLEPESITTEKIVCARLLHIDAHDTPAVAQAPPRSRTAITSRLRWTSTPSTTASIAYCRTWIIWWPAPSFPCNGPTSAILSARSK